MEGSSESGNFGKHETFGKSSLLASGTLVFYFSATSFVDEGEATPLSSFIFFSRDSEVVDSSTRSGASCPKVSGVLFKINSANIVGSKANDAP